MRQTRRASVEKKKNMRSAILLVILTVGIGLGFFFFGVPIIAKYSSLLFNVRKSGETIDPSDTTPPLPPQFENIPEATNKTSIKISGSAEPGVNVEIHANGKTDTLLVNKSGEFTYQFDLRADGNSIWAKSIDGTGNESQKSETYEINFDNTDPSLTISQPDDGASFFGNLERQIMINGTTDVDTEVTINDRFVIVDSEGNFSYTSSLTEGENSFNIKAKDAAGNESEKTISVTYST